MVERICPECQHGNPLDNRFCGHCGTSLERNHLVAASEHEPTDMLVKPDTTEDVTAHLKHVGKAVAVGLATLAAEAGLAWLRRKVEHIGQPTPTVSHQAPAVYQQPVVHHTSQPAPTSVVPAHHQPHPTGIVTVLSQRIVETWEHGVLTRQTVERNVWRREAG